MNKDAATGLLSTTSEPSWTARAYPENDEDPRGAFQRDRDRILHCSSFRKLQHKTQVFLVSEGDFFRTRLTHTLEVAQIGRTIGSMLDLTEPLIEAICLGHDLGHAPFGHAGEDALNRLLADHGLSWNSNAYSLTLVEEVEQQYCDHPGLNLTWATREGLARHKTKFDQPADAGEYDKYPQPSLEAQAASIADTIAYCAHDLEDALLTKGLLPLEVLAGCKIAAWDTSWHKAVEEFERAHPDGNAAGISQYSLLVKRARRHLIDLLIRDAVAETQGRITTHRVNGLAAARSLDDMLVGFSPEVGQQVDVLLDFMKARVYRSPLVARQNYRARHVLSRLFDALTGGPAGPDNEAYLLLPAYVQEQIRKGGRPGLEVARFLAGLTDRGAADLYAELFEPSGRAMGHQIE